jgi:osmotically-inducible protein OsmY
MKEITMNTNRILAAIVAAMMLAISAGWSDVPARQSSVSAEEQGGEQAKAAIRDAWLDGKLEATLLFNEHLNSFDIDTEVTNSVAWLHGTVESDIERDLAGEIAKSIEGVTDVENHLEVDQAKARNRMDSPAAVERQTFRQTVMNATLTARIKSRLLLNDNISGMAINVDSEDGVVTLSGEVTSDQERELAVRIAGNAEGARSVVDKLVVDESKGGKS